MLASILCPRAAGHLLCTCWHMDSNENAFYLLSQVPVQEEGEDGDDPLDHILCMECGGGQDEDLTLLCEGELLACEFPLCNLISMQGCASTKAHALPRRVLKVIIYQKQCHSVQIKSHAAG